jgi:hypothetical protein
MIAPRIVSLVAAFVLTSPAALFSQEQATVAPGDRVRVTAPTVDPDPFVGKLVALGTDTCVLEVEGRPGHSALPFGSVERLEVSLGQKTKAGQYAGMGGLIGGVMGVGIALGACSGGECEGVTGDLTGAAAVVFGIGGAGVGALLGAGIGSGIKVDRWETVPLDRLRVSVVPQRGGGVSVGVRLKV